MAGFSLTKEYDDVFVPISQGWATAQINKAVLTESKKGDPMLVLQYKILAPNKDLNKTCRDYVVLVDESWGYGRLGKICLAADPNMVGCTDATPNGFDPHDQQSCHRYLLGQVFNVRIKHTVTTGDGGEERTWANADKYGYCNPTRRQGVYAEIGGQPDLDDEAFCDFDGVSLTASNGGGYSPNAPQSTPTEEDHWDNPEIPF